MAKRDAERAPWERQPGETVRAYAAFCVYRDLFPQERSLRRAAEELAKTDPKSRRAEAILRVLKAWSAKYRWVERVKAWDDEQDRLNRARQLREIQEMRERHANIAKHLQAKAYERLKRLDPDELEAPDVLRYFVEAARLERLARGEPDIIAEQRGTVTVHAQNLGIIERIIADPEARELARQLYSRVASNTANAGPGGSGELREVGDEEPVDSGPTFGPARK